MTGKQAAWRTVTLQDTIPGSQVTLEMCQVLPGGLTPPEGWGRCSQIETFQLRPHGLQVGGWGRIGVRKHRVPEGSPLRDTEARMRMLCSRTGKGQGSQGAGGGAQGGALGGGRANCELCLKGRQGPACQAFLQSMERWGFSVGFEIGGTHVCKRTLWPGEIHQRGRTRSREPGHYTFTVTPGVLSRGDPPGESRTALEIGSSSLAAGGGGMTGVAGMAETAARFVAWVLGE